MTHHVWRVIVIAVVWMVVKSMNTNSRSDPPSGKSALDILKERYARGEITKDQFESIKKDL